MSRNRIIYNVLSLYAGQNNAQSGVHTGVGAVQQLTRVQSFDEDFARNIKDINQYGQLNVIDRIEVQSPTVKSSFSYYLTNGSNEQFMGLTLSPTLASAGVINTTNLVSCLSGFVSKVTDEKNYFLLIADEGYDAVGYTNSRTGVIGLGNAYLNSYSVEAAVGEVPKATVNLEALNVRVYTGATGGDNVPAIQIATSQPVTGVPFSLQPSVATSVSNQVSALQPGDITVNITGTNGVSISDLKLQNFKLDFNLNRKAILRLGYKYAYSREIEFPVKATFSIDAELGDLQSQALSDIAFCETGFQNLSVVLKQPNCQGTGNPAMIFNFNGAKLISQKVSTAIGSNAKFTATFENQMGAANDTQKGVFIQGSYQNAGALQS